MSNIYADSNTGIIAVVVVILVILVIVMLPLIVLWCVRRRQRNQGYDYQGTFTIVLN